MITKQEMFNRAYRGLASQGWRRSLDENDACKYNGPNGTHCAWGHIDKRVPRHMEGQGLEALRRMRSGLARTLSDELFEFAKTLQWEHDLNSSPRAMRLAFRSIAKEHKLKIPAVRP